MKCSVFGFGSPQQQVTLEFSYNMHLFLPYLLTDSQMIRSMIHFSKPLICVNLICGDCSDWLISFKAVVVIVSSADLCTAVTGETAIFNAPKEAPCGNKWAGNMLMFHFDTNMIQSTLSFVRQYLYNFQI